MKKLLAGIVVSCLVSGAGLASSQTTQDKDPGVEVATVKPSNPDETGELCTIRGRHILTINTPALDLIRFAFGLHPSQIIGAPEWLSKEKFDIDAVPASDSVLKNEQMWMMIRRILADRFRLKYEFVEKNLPAYALVKAGKDLALKKSLRRPEDPWDFYGPSGELNVNNATMKNFAEGLSRGMVDKPVVDQTGIEGRYDFVLKWSGLNAVNDPNVPPGIFTALQEQVGLALKPTHADIKVLRIDHVEHPGDN